MRWLLNSAVITAPGRYRYRLVSADEATAWLRAGQWTSRIGYIATAEHILELAGTLVTTSREATTMQVGDEALVVRLAYRVADPATKAHHRPAPDAWEYGLLTREDDAGGHRRVSDDR